MRTPSGPPAALRQSFGPLVELLERELRIAGRPPPGPAPASTGEFARWYLAAVQALEASVAGSEQRAPMGRDELELMCRAALSAGTLGEAIGLVQRFCTALHPRAGRVQLQRRRGGAAFVLDSLRPAATTASSLVDITGLFAFLQLLQWLGGGPLDLQQVRIGPMRREDVLPFLRLFGAPVLAGGRDYALEFPSAVLTRAVVRTRGEFTAFFEVFPCGVFERSTHTPAQQVAALLGAAAARGARLPGLAEVASALQMPPSTLRRRLGSGAGSFRALREHALAEQAGSWLARGDLNVGEIAERLGFSDASAFRRAFRRWSGTAPTAWREAQAAPAILAAPPPRRAARRRKTPTGPREDTA